MKHLAHIVTLILMFIISSCEVDQIALEKIQKQYQNNCKSAQVSEGQDIFAICNNQSMYLSVLKQECSKRCCSVMSSVKAQCANAGLFVTKISKLKSAQVIASKQRGLNKIYFDGLDDKEKSFYVNDQVVHDIIAKYGRN